MKRISRRAAPILTTVLLLTLVVPGKVWGQDFTPRAVIEDIFSKIKGLLDEPDARDRIMGLAMQGLDMDRIAARITNDAFVADEKKRMEIVPLLAGLFERQYYHQAVLLKKREIQIVGENQLKNGDVVVDTDIVGGANTVKVSYTLYRFGGRWKIYDVRVDGTSIVDSYRAQFSQILRRLAGGDTTVALQLLKEKMGEINKP